MTRLLRPVERVGDVVVVGERHSERGSRSMVFEAWDELTEEIGGVCVEADPSFRYRSDGGGGIGGALCRAESQGLPRFYVDESVDDTIEAFGGRFSAYSYLKGLKKRYPPRDDGWIDSEVCSTVRTEIKEDYGEKAFELVCTNREEKMAGRAKWVADSVEGVVMLIVGSAHFQPIVSILEDDCKLIPVDNHRVRTGTRDMRGPWNILFSQAYTGCKQLGKKLYEITQEFFSEKPSDSK